MRQRFGDRRKAARFDVLGRLGLSLFSSERLRLLNIGRLGALVDSAVPLGDRSLHSMRLMVDRDITDVTVRVRRVVQITQEPSVLRYLIGLEFVQPSAEAEAMIGRLMSSEPAAS